MQKELWQCTAGDKSAVQCGGKSKWSHGSNLSLVSAQGSHASDLVSKLHRFDISVGISYARSSLSLVSAHMPQILESVLLIFWLEYHKLVSARMPLLLSIASSI